MKKLLSAALFLGAALAFTSCEKDSDNGPSYDLSKGMIIVNEGIDFGSISHYNPTNDAVTNDVFKTVNNREVGKFLQSICSNGRNAYLVVGGSDKVEVINRSTSQEVATITDLKTPRYMVANGTTGYVSLWGTDEVAVIDLTNNSIKQRIKVGPDPEGMLIYNNMLYVANSSGSGGKNNTISVINISSNTVEKTITVADFPVAFTIDKNNMIWVLCAGYSDWNNADNNTNAAICKMDPATYAITKIDLGSYHFDRFQINSAKDKLYFSSSWGAPGIYQMDIAATAAPTIPFISGNFYGFAINPSNDEMMVMVADWKVATNNKMVRYTTTGAKIKEYVVGTGPNGGYFFN